MIFRLRLVIVEIDFLSVWLVMLLLEVTVLLLASLLKAWILDLAQVLNLIDSRVLVVVLISQVEETRKMLLLVMMVMGLDHVSSKISILMNTQVVGKSL